METEIKTGNRFFRCVYSYEFSDNYVYVGLTYNLYERQIHRDSHPTDAVTRHKTKTGLIPIRKQITEYISIQEARKLEGETLKKYEKCGWYILNSAPTGGIGSTILIWTKEKCINAAKLCDSRSEFCKKYRGAYSASVKNGWIGEIRNILKKKYQGGKILHTFDKCKEKSLLCKTKAEFKQNYLKEFSAAYNNGWLDEICGHMIRAGIKWTKENCYDASLNCRNRFTFKKKHKGAYEASLKNNWLNEFYA